MIFEKLVVVLQVRVYCIDRVMIDSTWCINYCRYVSVVMLVFTAGQQEDL